MLQAHQLVVIGTVTFVVLEFVVNRSCTRAVTVHKVWDGGVDEHLIAEVHPGRTLRVDTSKGEQWVVREGYTDLVLLNVNATEQRFQRIFIQAHCAGGA